MPPSIESPPRYNVLGVGVHALKLEQARDLIIAKARDRAAKGYVCFCDVNSVSAARRDPRHRAILNHSFLTTPDGMPLVWLGHRAGHRAVQRVYGPDLFQSVCAATAIEPLNHFLLGGGPGTGELLAGKLKRHFPGLRIVGNYTPPFRPLNPEEWNDVENRIRETEPHFIWVGLSTPKQERFMVDFLPRLSAGVMLGIGAAFDFLSGRIPQAPRWIQRSGFEWLYRLSTEPRRLAPRYLKNNPLFLLKTAAQLTGLKTFPLEAEKPSK